MKERKFQEAVAALLGILGGLHERRGALDRAEIGEIALAGSKEEVALVYATRLAAAWGQLVSDPDFSVTPSECERLLIHHRWLDILFALSGFRSSQHLAPAHVLGRLVSLCAHAHSDDDLEQSWRADPAQTALALLHYISSRHFYDARSHQFRERILRWLPQRLGIIRLGALTLRHAHSIYMHCSYARTPDKHEIKRALMAQLRRVALDGGCVEASTEPRPSNAERPTVVVIAENLRLNHAVYRTHSQAVRSLRERFHVVGVVFPDPAGSPIAELFDEVVPTPPGDLFKALPEWSKAIVGRAPDLAFFLGVGMIPNVVALASLRLAPVQCVSFGHTATTMSPTIDYFVLPEDFVAAPHTFSEKVHTVPREAMPTVPPPLPTLARRAPDGRVRVAIPGSVMKLNPHVFDAIAAIAKGAKVAADFHFFPVGAVGLPHQLLTREVKARIPNATVYTEAPHDTYMQRLAQCDMFLCPFPYGNMNSIVDTFLAGLPGVCLDGEESHSHADAAYFARIGLPAELSAQSEEGYVQAATRLINDEAWRGHCAQLVRNADLEAAFFRGRPELFCEAMLRLVTRA